MSLDGSETGYSLARSRYFIRELCFLVECNRVGQVDRINNASNVLRLSVRQPHLNTSANKHLGLAPHLFFIEI